MNSEFEQLLALLSAPVIDLLNEQESCENGNNILDLQLMKLLIKKIIVNYDTIEINWSDLALSLLPA